MKYKVGDKVRVRRDLDGGKDYGKRAVVPEMTNLKGMIATIKSVGRDYYELEEDTDLFDWTDEMLEGLDDEQVTGKLRLIDVLNLISNKELKDDTKVIFEDIELTYKNGDLEDEDGYSITCIMNNTSDLLTEVELILPQEPIKSKEKLVRLDLSWLLWQSSSVFMSEVVNKINEIVDYINEVKEDEQSTK